MTTLTAAKQQSLFNFFHDAHSAEDVASTPATPPVTTPTAAEHDALVELYIGYFNRAPEASGLKYWSDQLVHSLNTGKTESDVLKDISNQFYEAGKQFNIFSPTAPVDSFITVAYKNALGRDSVDDAGLTYWTNKLNSGEVSRGELVQQLIQAAKGLAGDANWGWVANYLNNRKAVASHFAENSADLSGQEAIDTGSVTLSLVTPETAKAGETESEAVAVATKQTFKFTTAAVENITLSAGVDHLIVSAGSSTYAASDTVTGSNLVLNAAGMDIDPLTSDTIRVGGVTSGSHLTDFVKFTTAQTNLDLALKDAAAAHAAGGAAEVVFQLGGNTYIYADVGASLGVADPTDVLVKLTGTINLDALVLALHH